MSKSFFAVYIFFVLSCSSLSLARVPGDSAREEVSRPAAAQRNDKALRREACSHLYVDKPVTVLVYDNSPKGIIVGLGPEQNNGDRLVMYRLTEPGCIKGYGCAGPGEVGEMFSCGDFK